MMLSKANFRRRPAAATQGGAHHRVVPELLYTIAQRQIRLAATCIVFFVRFGCQRRWFQHLSRCQSWRDVAKPPAPVRVAQRSALVVGKHEGISLGSIEPRPVQMRRQHVGDRLGHEHGAGAGLRLGWADHVAPPCPTHNGSATESLPAARSSRPTLRPGPESSSRVRKALERYPCPER